ncbi:MAG: sulfite exporter TauE/SafE family protein [Rhodospirillales bacterium]
MSDPLPSIFGIVLFDGLDGWHVGTLVLVYIGSYFIKGAIGVGNLAIMVLIGALILTPHHAVVLALVTTFFAQFQFLREGIKYTDWPIAKSVILSAYIGLGIGVWIFSKVDGTWLTLFVGATLGLMIVADLTHGLSRMSAALDFRKKTILYPTMIGFGLISGIGGAGTLSGVTFYLKQITPSARVLRGTIMMLGIIFASWRVFLFGLTGYLTWNIVIEVVILMPVMLFFGYLGAKFFSGLSDKRYHQYLQYMLLCIAVILVGKSLVKLAAGT